MKRDALPQEALQNIADFLPPRETLRLDKAGAILTKHRLLNLQCGAACNPWRDGERRFRAGLCFAWLEGASLPGTVATSRQGCVRVTQPLVVVAELRDLAGRGSKEACRWLRQVRALLVETRHAWEVDVLDAVFFGTPLDSMSASGRRPLRRDEEELLGRWCHGALLHDSVVGWDFPSVFEDDCAKLNDAALTKKTARRLAILLPRRALRLLPSEFRTDRALVEAALRQDGAMLRHVPSELRGDRGLVGAAIAQSGSSLQHASKELRNDRGLVEAAVRGDGLALEHASTELRADRAVVEAAIGSHGLALQYAAPRLKGDLELVTAAVRRSGAAFQHASAQLRSEPQLLALALRDDAVPVRDVYRHALGAASVEKSSARAALRRDPDVFEDFASALRQDADVAHAAVAHAGLAYSHVLPAAKSKALLLQALATAPKLFQHLDLAERSDRDVASAALAADPGQFAHASDELRNDNAFARRAVLLRPENFDFAGPRARDDLEVARLAVAYDPRNFEGVGASARDDADLALAAVSCGVPLSFAGPAAKNDPRVVLAALRWDARAFPHAGLAARENKQVALAALRGRPTRETWAAVGSAIRHDPDVAASLKRCRHRA